MPHFSDAPCTACSPGAFPCAGPRTPLRPAAALWAEPPPGSLPSCCAGWPTPSGAASASLAVPAPDEWCLQGDKSFGLAMSHSVLARPHAALTVAATCSIARLTTWHVKDISRLQDDIEKGVVQVFLSKIRAGETRQNVVLCDGLVQAPPVMAASHSVHMSTNGHHEVTMKN